MNSNEYAKVIANNLREIMYKNNKTQVEVAKALNVSKATLSSWMNGTRIPRMNNVDMLCHYFNVSRADIMEKHDQVQILGQQKYYTDDRTAEIAQKIFDNKELRLLFDEAVDASPEDLQTAHDILLALKRKERGTID